MTPPGLGNTIRSVVCTVGVHHMARTLHRKQLLIVMYHGVTNDRRVAQRWWHHVLDREFERQVRYLKTHYDVLPIDDALSALWSGELSHPTACITFDDGYRNNADVAFPMLERLQVPATIYVATGMIGTRRGLWTIELDHAFTASTASTVDLSVLGLGERKLHQHDHRVLFRRVLNAVKDVKYRDRPTVLRTIYDQLKAPDDPVSHEPFLMMDWTEVEAVSDTPFITIGGHTVNHEIVSRLDDDDVKSEITDSIKAVENHCKNVSKTFAYPNGEQDDFDDRAIQAVRSSGCIGAVTTIEALCDRDTDHYQLQRIGVGSDTSFDQFKLLTSGLITDVKKFKPSNRQ